MNSILETLRSILEWFREQDLRLIFGAAVAIMLVLRAAGYASFAVFVALIYIMWFVSIGGRR